MSAAVEWKRVGAHLMVRCPACTVMAEFPGAQSHQVLSGNGSGVVRAEYTCGNCGAQTEASIPVEKLSEALGKRDRDDFDAQLVGDLEQMGFDRGKIESGLAEMRARFGRDDFDGA